MGKYILTSKIFLLLNIEIERSECLEELGNISYNLKNTLLL